MSAELSVSKCIVVTSVLPTCMLPAPVGSRVNTPVPDDATVKSVFESSSVATRVTVPAVDLSNVHVPAAASASVPEFSNLISAVPMFASSRSIP